MLDRFWHGLRISYLHPASAFLFPSTVAIQPPKTSFPHFIQYNASIVNSTSFFMTNEHSPNHDLSTPFRNVDPASKPVVLFPSIGHRSNLETPSLGNEPASVASLEKSQLDNYCSSQSILSTR